MTESTSETRSSTGSQNMTADSVAASNLDPETLMLVRIAALVAVDAPAFSYLSGGRTDCRHGVSHPLPARSLRRSTPRSRWRSWRSKSVTWIVADHFEKCYSDRTAVRRWERGVLPELMA
jgi:hypothetical protein